jgi:ATP-dependent exoDNAse (exonuclease V) alpha subunit
MRWAFQVERTTLDRRNLFDLLEHVGYEPIDVPGSEIALRSESLDTLTNAADVWDHAKRLRELVANVTEIDPEFALGPVVDLSGEVPKRHHFLEVESCISTTSVGSVTLSVHPPDDLSAQQLCEWTRRRAEQEYQTRLEAQRAMLEPAFRDPRAAKLLHLLKRKSHTGETLNKIYELAEGHPSRRKEFQARFGISEVEFKRFADAVHNPIVSGDLARHAYEDKPKTANPMSLAEAEAFAKGIAQRWLASLRG